MVAPRTYQTTIKVRFDETDAVGVVHFSNYFRYFGIGYADLMDSIGFPPLKGGARVSEDITFPRREANCRYYAPARFGEELTLSTGLSKVTRSNLTFRFSLRRGRRRIAEGSVTCVAVDKKRWKSIAIPPKLLDRLRKEGYLPRD